MSSIYIFSTYLERSHPKSDDLLFEIFVIVIGFIVLRLLSVSICFVVSVFERYIRFIS